MTKGHQLKHAAIIFRQNCEWWENVLSPLDQVSRVFFTNVSQALQNILSKCVYRRNSTCDDNFKLKLCMCAQSRALGTRTKFQLEILPINVISGVVYFREIILASSRNGGETTPCLLWHALNSTNYAKGSIFVMFCADQVQGWGLLSQIPPFRYFLNFAALSKHTLAIVCHVYTWQVSPQLSCGDICQI